MAAVERPLRGRRALVTGASSGIGEAIATRLAQRGADLVITARREDQLHEVARRIATDHRVQVDVVAADLGAAGAASAVWIAATVGGPVDLLVNNAGFGYFRAFATADFARDAELVQLNITSLVELCHRFVAHHRATASDHRVHLMNVASTLAFQAVPNYATYAASKMFVRFFTEALHYELRGSPISATCVCPGGTRTAFHATAGAGGYGRIATASMMTADRVAEIAVRAMLRGKKTVVTGFVNKLSCFLAGLAPGGVSARAARYVLGAPGAAALPPRTGAPP